MYWHPLRCTRLLHQRYTVDERRFVFQVKSVFEKETKVKIFFGVREKGRASFLLFSFK